MFSCFAFEKATGGVSAALNETELEVKLEKVSIVQMGFA